MAGFRPRLRVGWCFAGLGVVLLVASVIFFTWRPDRFAAFTTLPFGAWMIPGAGSCCLAAWLLRRRWPWRAAFAWLVACVVFSEEIRPQWWWRQSLTESNKPPAAVRVLSLNCASFRFGDPSADIAFWRPDVILLQETTPHHAARIGNAAFGKSYVASQQFGLSVVSRWPLRSAPQPFQRTSQHCTVLHPSGSSIDLVNVHLSSAATDLRLWKRDAWRAHRSTRKSHEEELTAMLREFPVISSTQPRLIGGDFNTPSGDPLHGMLTPQFNDAFHAAGSGWPNTFQRRLPVLRIDYLYTNPVMRAVSCRVITSKHSDHRMVVGDFLLSPTSKP